MKKIITLFIMISTIYTVNGDTFVNDVYKSHKDSLIGFWKGDTLSIENVTPGFFPDMIVQVNGTVVLIKYTTKANEEIEYFEIERCTDLKSWVKLTKLIPQPSNIYEYEDAPHMEGIIYYRVRQVDKSKQERYSIIKAVNINGDHSAKVWPNPVNDILFIQTHLITGSVEIVDMTGRLIRKDNIYNTITTIPVSTLSPGIYVIRIRYHEFVVTANFIKT